MSRITTGWVARHTPQGPGGRQAALIDIAQDLFLAQLDRQGIFDHLVLITIPGEPVPVPEAGSEIPQRRTSEVRGLPASSFPAPELPLRLLQELGCVG